MMSLPVWLPGPMFLPGGLRARVSVRGFSVHGVSVVFCRENPPPKSEKRVVRIQMLYKKF